MISNQDFRDYLHEHDCPGFLIPEDIFNFAQTLVNQERISCGGPARLPTDAIQQGPVMVIATPYDESIVATYVLERSEDGLGTVVSSVKSSFNLLRIGTFTPGGYSSLDALTASKLPQGQAQLFAHFLDIAAFTLSLINQPRVLKLESLLPRQQRRAAERGGAKSVNAWSRVTWDLSKETSAKVSRDPSYHKVALHWRRGHFRRAEEHYKGAVQRPDALRPEERDLWWQWIEGQWVGHPAFGVKMSVHAPRLSTGKLAKGSAP